MKDDFLLIAIVVASILAALGALLVMAYKVLEEIRERAAMRGGDRHERLRTGSRGLSEHGVRSAYPVSAIRH